MVNPKVALTGSRSSLYDSSDPKAQLPMPLPAQLDRYTTRIYLLAVRTPGLTRRQMVAAGIPTSMIDPAIKELVDSGMLRSSGSPDVWEAIPPDIALPALASTYEVRAALARDTAHDLAQLYRTSRARAEEAPSGVAVLSTTEELQSAAETVMASACTEVLACYDDSPRTAHMFKMALEQHRERLITVDGTPLRLRSTFDTSVLQYQGAGDVLLARIEGGEEARFLDSIPFTTIVADDVAAVVDLTSFDTSGGGSLLIRDRRVVLALRALGEAWWSLATPMAWKGLSALDRQSVFILSLLAAGATDSTIAAQSGMSQRTVERRVRALMTQLGASTRFQAGVQAVRRGWI
ncbi:helix-turn-helix transcriptional regulator [Gephyromycinifex aptenodytis]|uniref:helix-turn-helix transcriptional regulator n=1 Tax=Gephyromycinifex aptenodytis TaxID=2716227 RepID=UPI00144543BE|nr:helix-turn-helix transcriptional regulator [Gephyromycinifex aptenodytis]